MMFVTIDLDRAKVPTRLFDLYMGRIAEALITFSIDINQVRPVIVEEQAYALWHHLNEDQAFRLGMAIGMARANMMQILDGNCQASVIPAHRPMAMHFWEVLKGKGIQP